MLHRLNMLSRPFTRTIAQKHRALAIPFNKNAKVRQTINPASYRLFSGTFDRSARIISRTSFLCPIYVPFRKFSTSSSPNHFLYNILGVNSMATDGEIKEAYIEQCKKYHPDSQGGNDMKFQEIMKAYTVLKNESERKEYDSFNKEQYIEFMKEWTKLLRSADVNTDTKAIIRSQKYVKKSNREPHPQPRRESLDIDEIMIKIVGAYAMGAVISFTLFFIWGCINQNMDVIIDGIMLSMVWPLAIIYYISGLIVRK